MACYKPSECWFHVDGGRPLFYFPVGDDPRLWRKGMARCRHCIGCKADAARDVSIRAGHEAAISPASSFLTLTYDREHLPEHGSIRRADVVLFMKRLRKYCWQHFQIKVRAYYVAEYGGRTGRAHYHVCLFGFDFSADWRPHGRSKSGKAMWLSATLEALWGKGLCVVQEMGQEAAQYAAKYSLKAIGQAKGTVLLRVPNGALVTMPVAEYRAKLADGTLVGSAVESPFHSLPRGRALGLPWLDLYWSDVFPRGVVILRGGVELSPPLAYLNLYREYDPDGYAELAARRHAEGLPRFDDFSPERLLVREVVHEARASHHRQDAL